jgi:hypothetical protein
MGVLLRNEMTEMVLQSFITNIVLKISSLIDTFSLEPEQISSPDRLMLEGTILPYFAHSPSVHKVLFVGCSAYTRRYEAIFNSQEYWTIDPKRVKRKYGSARHIVDSISNIGGYVVHEYFDVIILNGVIGYGLNRISAIGQAIDACHAALASDGILLLGWNDTAQRAPLDIRTIHALGKFSEYYFEPVQACHYRTEGPGHHTYSFYRKA